MKKVLIVAGYWGTRIPGLIKYLPEFGWQPILLTTSTPFDVEFISEFPVINTPRNHIVDYFKKFFRIYTKKDIRSKVKERFGLAARGSSLDHIFNLCGGLFHYPDSFKGWRRYGVNLGNDILEREKIEVLISSSSPVTSHIIARQLKIRHKVRWIADLRDLWTQNHNYYYSRLRRSVERRLEVKTLKEADALVTVSNPWAKKLSVLHSRQAVNTITNGFDPEPELQVPEEILSKLTITYTGKVYLGKQNPSKFFEALRKLIIQTDIDPGHIQVRFYGPPEQWLDKQIKEYGLIGIVKQYGVVQQRQALEKQRNSHLLLLFDWEDYKEDGCYPLKVFEYLGAARPVLVTGGRENNVVRKLIKETKTGVCATQVEDIKAALKRMYQEYMIKGRLTYNGDETAVSRYSYRQMTGSFVEIINKL